MEDMITRAKKKYREYLISLHKAEQEKKKLKALMGDPQIEVWTKTYIKQDIEYKEEDCRVAYGRASAAEHILVAILGIPLKELKNIQEEVKRRKIE